MPKPPWPEPAATRKLPRQTTVASTRKYDAPRCKEIELHRSLLRSDLFRFDRTPEHDGRQDTAVARFPDVYAG